jgi:hypothetical protein
MAAFFTAIGATIGKSIMTGVLFQIGKSLGTAAIASLIPGGAGAAAGAAGAGGTAVAGGLGAGAAFGAGAGIGAALGISLTGHEIYRMHGAEQVGKTLAQTDIDNLQAIKDKEKSGMALTEDEQSKLALAENHRANAQRIVEHWKNMSGVSKGILATGAVAHIESAQKELDDITTAQAYQLEITKKQTEEQLAYTQALRDSSDALRGSNVIGHAGNWVITSGPRSANGAGLPNK